MDTLDGMSVALAAIAQSWFVWFLAGCIIGMVVAVKIAERR